MFDILLHTGSENIWVVQFWICSAANVVEPLCHQAFAQEGRGQAQGQDKRKPGSHKEKKAKDRTEKKDKEKQGKNKKGRTSPTAAPAAPAAAAAAAALLHRIPQGYGAWLEGR